MGKLARSARGGLTDAALAAAYFDARLYVFHKGMNNRIYFNTLDSFSQSWGSWQEVPGDGRTYVPLAAASFNGYLYVFHRGIDKRIYYDSFGIQRTAPGVEKVPPETQADKQWLSRVGTLSVTTDPKAEVLVDGVSRGTYGGKVPVNVTNLAPGPHTIRCRCSGYRDEERTVTVNAGRTQKVRCVLQKVLPTTGTLYIETRPLGAEVSVDGVPRGTFTGPKYKPLAIPNLAPGPHTVRCRLAGYQDYETTVTVKAGNTSFNNPIRIYELLPATGATGTPPPATGVLNIYSTPSGAEVSVDGVPHQGTAPASVFHVAPGSHTVTCRLCGYSDYTETVSVNAGKATAVNCKLLPSTGPTGSLSILSKAFSGAEVSVDGVPRGTIPVTVDCLAPGPHNVSWRAPGHPAEYFEDHELTVTVKVGNANAIELLPYYKGAIFITSSPCCADVFVDEEPRGSAPITVPNLWSGSHTVRCTLAGYQAHEAYVTVENKQTTNALCDMLPIAPESDADNAEEHVKPRSTRENPLPMSTPVDLGDGWQIRVLKVDPSSSQVYTIPKDGYQFFTADIEATFTGSESDPFNPSRLDAIGASSVSYLVSFASVNSSGDPNAKVYKGGICQIWIIWPVKSSDVSSLELYDSSRSLGEREYISLNPL